MTTFIKRLLAAAALAAATACALNASVLVLKNGCVLSGTVIRREDGRIHFKDDIIGEVVVDESAVTAIEKGPAVPATPKVAAPAPAPAPAAAVAVVKVPAVPTVTRKGILGWNGKVECGYDNTSSSDIRTVAMNARIEAEHKVKAEDYLAKTSFLYGSTDGVAATDQGDAEFRWRHNLSDRLFTQSDTTYETDRVKLIHYQVEQNAGVGYRILQNAHNTVNVGTGVTGEQLDATGVQKGFTYLGKVFQDYVLRLNDRYTLKEDASADYSPESRGLSGLVPDTVTVASGTRRDYAYQFKSSLEGRINGHFSLNLHFEYKYDNAVVVPTARAEQRVTTNLGYGF
jgi:putative salt-induced outer membrane protein YdiY